MIVHVDGSVRLMCDWCYARTPPGEHPDAPAMPKRWGSGMVVHTADRLEARHACPRHTRQLRAWERNGLEAVR